MRSSTWLLPLILILSLASFLRLYQLGNIPLYNDELSAISRLAYDSYGELVEKGIKPDGHPAGVQSFLYIWYGMVGDHTLLLRLPFVLLSILSVFMIFLLGKNMFHETAGLFAASLFAFLQYPVFFGIQIRPYPPGLFFVLLMLWFGYSFWRAEGEGKWKYLIGFVFAAVMATYTHYFAGLQVILVYLMGWFWVKGKDRTPYALAALAILVLYLPHMGIFLAQIQKGGIGGWLGSPDWGFLRGYLQYLLHHSWIMGLTILFGWMLGLSQKFKLDNLQRPFRRLMGMGFFLPLLIGFLYSIWVNPVLHAGSMYFALPFLLLFAASFLPSIQPRIQLMLLVGLMTIGTSSLLLERRHFAMSMERGNLQVVKDHQQWEEVNQQDSLTHMMIQNDTAYKEITFRQLGWKPTYQLGEQVSYPAFRKKLEAIDDPFFAISWVSSPIQLEYVAVAKEFFPYVKRKKDYVVSEFYGLSTEAEGKEELLPLQTITQFADKIDTSFKVMGRQAERIEEFGPSVEFVMDSLGEDWVSSQLWLSADFYMPESNDASLVLSMEKDSVEVYRRAIPLLYFTDTLSQWTWAHQVQRFHHTLFYYKKPETAVTVKAYIWNPSRLPLWTSEIRLEMWPGNNRLYGLIEK
ncbi:MAG: glycosyltransferase family 39 protein [Bacteroidota bacterium]